MCLKNNTSEIGLAVWEKRQSVTLLLSRTIRKCWSSISQRLPFFVPPTGLPEVSPRRKGKQVCKDWCESVIQVFFTAAASETEQELSCVQQEMKSWCIYTTWNHFLTVLFSLVWKNTYIWNKKKTRLQDHMPFMIHILAWQKVHVCT